ncbi:hypothetical protein PF005_g20654 [Phytophthora fragariae]|uniref:Uncharacterized protein n=2 Tax=Phytophthora TaxID=4783 RepID=A0A6A3WPF0_9STRA|nr:hypothetical protein PF003_g19116 [Phytophthora fragariae]KAE9043987.1 hypothetical protein PR002_g3050 [Phytophthora rubi]KAE8939924.1 hypothetical protein PF009_g10259 [Phytophthora fragariae]KAE8977339.1 hypothetical protein PF011_g23688 [Phytophthora fragariae]KAE9099647.1 hypothetical protein PF007_g15800 [Phytophthora fragariae]
MAPTSSDTSEPLETDINVLEPKMVYSNGTIAAV